MKKESSAKATPPFKREPLEVQHQKGTQVVTKTRDGCTITQSMADFKMVPYQTSEEAGRWKSRPCASQEELPKPSGDPTELPRMKEQPHELQILEFDTRILRELGTIRRVPSRATSVTPRLRKPEDITGEYLRSKYPEHELPDNFQ